jgi:hypothetical protein
MPENPAREKLAIVTGASRGLGFAMAQALAFRGWHVVAIARTVGGLEELDDGVRKAGLPGAGGLTLAPMDVTQDEAMRHLCLSVHDRWGGAGLWVHAAVHAAPLTPAPMIAARDWAKSVAVNVQATQVLIGMIAPLLQAHDGTAVFFDDPAGGKPFFGSYGATKAAQMALARSWQAETHRIGPRVVVATPAPMATATRARFFPGEDRSRLAQPATEAERLIAAL